MLWYIIAALNVIVAGTVGLIIFLLIKKRGASPVEQSKAVVDEPSSNNSFGLLEMEDGTRRILDCDAFLIGRHSSNDLTITDPSVSRQHAEIHHQADGSYTITDLDSMNGVFVNSKKVKHATIAGGEHVEFGDVGCQFKLVAESNRNPDQSVMLSPKQRHKDYPD